MYYIEHLILRGRGYFIQVGALTESLSFPAGNFYLTCFLVMTCGMQPRAASSLLRMDLSRWSCRSGSTGPASRTLGCPCSTRSRWRPSCCSGRGDRGGDGVCGKREYRNLLPLIVIAFQIKQDSTTIGYSSRRTEIIAHPIPCERSDIIQSSI